MSGEAAGSWAAAHSVEWRGVTLSIVRRAALAGETSARTSLRSSRRRSPFSTTVVRAQSRCVQQRTCVHMRGGGRASCARVLTRCLPGVRATERQARDRAALARLHAD